MIFSISIAPSIRPTSSIAPRNDPLQIGLYRYWECGWSHRGPYRTEKGLINQSDTIPNQLKGNYAKRDPLDLSEWRTMWRRTSKRMPEGDFISAMGGRSRMKPQQSLNEHREGNRFWGLLNEFRYSNGWSPSKLVFPFTHYKTFRICFIFDNCEFSTVDQ